MKGGLGLTKVMRFEFCCSKDSKLGDINESRGVPHFRLHREQTNLENEEDIKSLLSLVDMFKGADLWGSIPCGSWSPWQKMCLHRYGSSYAKKLKAKRKTSKKLLANLHKGCRENSPKRRTHCFRMAQTLRGLDVDRAFAVCQET